MNETLKLFRELTSVPTAPYYEEAVTRKALGWIKKNLKGVSVKRKRGGVIVSYTGKPGHPALVMAGHLDHPAFHLKGGKAKMYGRLDSKKVPGFRIEAFPAVPKDNTPLAVGVLGQGKDDLFEVRWDKKPATAAFATLALTPFKIEGKWLLSRSIDDLLGCAVSLVALKRSLGKQTNVTVLLHRAEEVGFMGALDLIHEGAVSKDDTILSIETSHRLPGAMPGKGPVIRLGDRASLFDPNVAALLDETKVKAQRLRLTGGTCEATAYLANGYESGGVAIPLVNYHNGLMDKAIAAEKVALSDVDGAVELLAAAAALFGTKNMRGVMRRRLTKLHADNAARLR